MKQIFFLLGCFLITHLLQAQIANIVQWNFSAKKIADKTYEIHLTPTIKSPWHIYSQTSPEGGALPTSVSFSKNPLVIIYGKTKEIGKVISKYEDAFGVTVKYFDDKAEFIQIVQLKTAAKTNVSGTIEYMVCNDEECLPPQTVPFNIPLQ